MLLLILFATLAIAISFICSVMEAALLSITPSYIAQLEEKLAALNKDKKSSSKKARKENK